MGDVELDKNISSVKITLLGKGMVGKSSLTYRFINFNAPEVHDPTIEDKFCIESNIDGKDIIINILDTAGQDDYQGLIDTWIDTGEGFLLVFAINDRESFDELDKKKSKIEAIKRSSQTPIILVGNKSDLDNEREVTIKEAEEKARSWNASYIETSAKNDVNCNEPFIECTKKLINDHISQAIRLTDIIQGIKGQYN